MTPSQAIEAGLCPGCAGTGVVDRCVPIDGMYFCTSCAGVGTWPPNDHLLELTRQYFPDGRPTWSFGSIAARYLGGGEWLVIIPLTFGRARLCVATAGDASLEHWCLDSPVEALDAWRAWPALPTRWNRHQRRDRVLEWPDGRTDEETDRV